MRILPVRLEDDQYEALRAYAFHCRKPMAVVVRESLAQWLGEHDAWFWTAEWQQAEREAEADIAAGRVETFESMNEFLESLDE